MIEKYKKLGLEYTVDLEEVEKAYAWVTLECNANNDADRLVEINDAYEVITNHIYNRNVLLGDGASLDKEIKEEIWRKAKEESQLEAKKKSKQVTNQEINTEVKIETKEESKEETRKDIKEEAKTDTNKELLEEYNNADAYISDNPERYIPIIKKLSNLMVERYLGDNTKIIDANRFRALREMDIYEDALMYPLFIKRMGDIFKCTVHDSSISDILEEDVEKARERFNLKYKKNPEKEAPDYESFLDIVFDTELSSSKSVVVRNEEQNEEDQYLLKPFRTNSKGKNPLLSVVIFIILIIIRIIFES